MAAARGQKAAGVDMSKMLSCALFLLATGSGTVALVLTAGLGDDPREPFTKEVSTAALCWLIAIGLAVLGAWEWIG
jgi:hypothetical protein